MPLIRWGRSAAGSVRLRCPTCKQTLTPLKKIRRHRYFSLFKKWIIKGIDIETLVQFKRGAVSAITLWRYFDKFLKNPLQPQSLRVRRPVYLKIDGKYFGHWGCILVFKEGTNIVYWDFVERENYFNYVLNLSRIKELGYDILGVTSDWHGSLVSAVRQAIPDVPHQRCLIHTQRLCENLLTRRPETEAGQNLLELVGLINQIKNHSEKKVWVSWLERFEQRYGDFVKTRTYGINKEGKKGWWFTHRNLRRAFLTLKNSLPSLFIYLDNPLIEKDTNGLESEFTHLVDKLRSRRGLKRTKRINFVRWYFYFKSIYFERRKSV